MRMHRVHQDAKVRFRFRPRLVTQPSSLRWGPRRHGGRRRVEHDAASSPEARVPGKRYFLLLLFLPKLPIANKYRLPRVPKSAIPPSMARLQKDVSFSAWKWLHVRRLKEVKTKASTTHQQKRRITPLCARVAGLMSTSPAEASARNSHSDLYCYKESESNPQGSQWMRDCFSCRLACPSAAMAVARLPNLWSNCRASTSRALLRFQTLKIMRS
jgi:hypothetical protein